jgi:hypothetical protein
MFRYPITAFRIEVRMEEFPINSSADSSQIIPGRLHKSYDDYGY